MPASGDALIWMVEAAQRSVTRFLMHVCKWADGDVADDIELGDLFGLLKDF